MWVLDADAAGNVLFAGGACLPLQEQYQLVWLINHVP
jgi:hypothetical protein